MAETEEPTAPPRTTGHASLGSGHSKAEHTKAPAGIRPNRKVQLRRALSRGEAGLNLPFSSKYFPPRPGSPDPSTPGRREGLRACYWEARGFHTQLDEGPETP